MSERADLDKIQTWIDDVSKKDGTHIGVPIGLLQRMVDELREHRGDREVPLETKES